jgi:hypothetical protein
MPDFESWLRSICAELVRLWEVPAAVMLPTVILESMVMVRFVVMKFPKVAVLSVPSA